MAVLGGGDACEGTIYLRSYIWQSYGVVVVFMFKKRQQETRRETHSTQLVSPVACCFSLVAFAVLQSNMGVTGEPAQFTPHMCRMVVPRASLACRRIEFEA